MSLLMPQRWKFRKQIIKNIKGKSTRGSSISFGECGLKATTSGFISNRQLEAARKVIVRHIKKVGKIWIRVYPDVPFTKKGLEMPMGKGKGDVEHYKAKIRKWRVLFELSGLDHATAQSVLLSACKKLPVEGRVVWKGEVR